MGFTQTFGGQNVNPAYLSYAAFTSATSLSLVWAFEAQTDADILAAKIDVSLTVASLSVTFPDASLVTPGQDALVTNVGSFSFTVLDNDGNPLGTVGVGQSWYFYLTDNSAAAGSWQATQLGAATSSADAAALAGAGLLAIMTTLNQNLITQPLAGDYAPSAGDRATVLRGTGGAQVYSPASGITLGNGWFVYVINNGTGTITWTPSGGQTVDGAATKVLQPTESAIFFSDGTNFWTCGYGRSVVNTVTGAVINIAGTGAYTLSNTQIAAQVQNYVGALTGDRIINMGTGAGFWLVSNATTGSHTVTFRVNGSDPGVLVSQGSFSILRSDGSNVNVAFTATSGTVTSVATTANLTGGPITTTGTLDLSNTAVTAGTYGDATHYARFTVDGKGRLTSAAQNALGTAAFVNTGTTSGTVPLLGSTGLVPSANGGASTGDIKFNIGTSITGWVLCAGTIGNAASAATNRANADTVNLYTLLWNSWADAQAPVSTGRGASAAADYAANKTITLPDLRGRLLAGLDNMVVGAASRLTATTMSPNGTTLGATGGAQTHTGTAVSVTGNVTVSVPSVDVDGNITAASANGGAGANVSSIGDSIHATTNSGVPYNSNATSNTLTGTVTGDMISVQPSLIMNVFIKL